MRVLSARKAPIGCLAFSPDGTVLAEAANGTVRLWNLADGVVAQTFVVKGDDPANMRLAFLPDGKLAVANGRVVLIDVTSGRQRAVRGPTWVRDVALSPDGGRLVATGRDLSHWSPVTGKMLPRLSLPVPWGHIVEMWLACSFAPTGSRLAVAREDAWFTGARMEKSQHVFVYEPKNRKVIAEIRWAGHPAKRLAFSPDGVLVAAACGPVLRMWDAASGEPVAEKQVGKLHFQGIAFSPDGRYIATVSKDHTTRLWQVGAWGEPRAFNWNVGALLDVAFAPDGTTAAVASDRGQIVLFDVD